MPYCPRCGVETDPSVRNCPLCSTGIPVFEDLGPGEPAWPRSGSLPPGTDPSKTFATPSQLRSRAFLTLAGVLATAALAVTLTDLFVHQGFTWSRYPLAALATVFALAASAFAFRRRPIPWGLTWTVLVAVFLALVDLADDGQLGWFPSLGFPITAATSGLIFAGAFAVHHSRRRGYNLFGLVPALVSVELLAIDGLVTRWASGQWNWGWSLIASLALLPLAFLFFVLHYALRRTPDLKRTFHF